MTLLTYTHTQPFLLESKEVLPGFELGYQTFGRLNADKSNVIWVFHALTGNTNVADWWAGIFGAGKALDPEYYFMVCVNMPGSCYGSIGPLSTNPESGKPYYHSFPLITPRDMAGMYQLLCNKLGIQKIVLGIGGSMGGMQLLEWSILKPGLFTNQVLIATNAQHSPWGIAFNAAQRMAIEADQTWANKQEDAGIKGMQAARAIAMLSYRNYHPFLQSQHESNPNKIDGFKAESYQYYQGEKLSLRFNAFSYYALSKSMDAHHVGRNRKSLEQALSSIRANSLVIGIESDVLFPMEEQLLLSRLIPNASFKLIDSPYGHDGFLIEFEQLNQLVEEFMYATGRNKNPLTKQHTLTT